MATASLNGAVLTAGLLLMASCGELGAGTNVGEDPTPHLSWADSVVSAYHLRSGTGANLQLRFHWEDSPFLDQHISGLKAEAAASLERDLSLLGLNSLRTPVDILYFDAREDLRPLTGIAPKGIALPEQNTLLIATNDSIRAYHTHELMHIVSIREWGPAADPADWIQEGLSMFADEPCKGHALYALAAYQLHQGTLYPLDTLTRNFRELEDVKSYVEAGAFTHYLIERFGMKSFEALWKAGWAELPQVTGSTMTNIEADYRDFLLQRFPTVPQVDWATLVLEGCG